MKMDIEKDKIDYKIKLLIREVKNKVLSINWHKKYLYITKKTIDS